MIEEEELKFMHDGKEHSQLVRHYKDVDSDAEPLDIFRRCLISNLSINIDLNHASFLKEFYQRFLMSLNPETVCQVQLEYKKELFPWVEDMKQLGIWYIKTEKDKEDEWKMYEKVRQDGWSLRVSWSLSQGSSRYISLYRLTWKFDIFKRE
uniref:Uncharacterized protein n=1 Tax=Acrobeloides nanus TaxID=290746 RepID=A0A914D4F7_9BILA